MALFASFAALTAPSASAGDVYGTSVTSWVANSEHGGGYNDPAARWVQQDVEGAAVDADGTTYAATSWDEGTSEVGVYKDGHVVGRLYDTHGWGRMGGSAVGVDAAYVYQAMRQSTQPGIDSPNSGTWYGFRRFYKSSRQQAGLPANGHSSAGSMRVVNSSAPVTGVASNGAEVYAAVAGEGLVHVYRTSDYAEVRSFAVPGVTQMALTGTGGLWTISGSEVREYSTSGTLRRTITGIDKPTAVALDPKGRLLITTDGARQQVLTYDVSANPVEVGAIGVLGGMFAAPRGTVGPLRFNGPVGVGADSFGNVYVADGLGGDGTDIRAIAPTATGWQEKWQLLGLAFVDNADLSPVDDTVAYTSRDRFALDLTKPAGQQWVWKAHTVDRFAYPDDGRSKNTHQYVTPDVLQLGGKTFLFETGMYQDTPRFYRFNGEIAVPSTPMVTGFRGWGWQVDDRGDVWNTDGTSVRHYSFLGLSTIGDPQYSTAQVTNAPAGFQSLQRVHYDRRTDSMFLSGWTTSHPRPAGNDMEKLIGSEVWRINSWSTGNRTPAWSTAIPFSRIGTDIRTLYGQIGLTFVGDRFFTVEMGTSKVRSYSSTSGQQSAEWMPGAEVGAFVGVVDVPDGIKASQRADGTYVVFVEEDHAAKVLMYTLPGTVTADAALAPAPITTVSPTASPTASPTVSPTASPTASPTVSPTASPTVSPSPSPTTSTTTVLAAYSAAVKADGPIARYGFEGGSNEGLPSGAVLTDGALPGSKAWSVTGPGQVLSGTPNTSTGTSWSMEGWVKVDPRSSAGARFWSTPGANWWGLARTYQPGVAGQNTPLISAYGAPTVTGGNAQEQIASGTTGSWQYIVVSATPTTTSLYVNGIHISQAAAVGMSLPGWALGSPSGSGFLGALDEVAFYNKALTQQQVTTHFTTATSPTTSPTATPTAASTSPVASTGASLIPRLWWLDRPGSTVLR